jgi:glycopeptide antibiotics resistance protein
VYTGEHVRVRKSVLGPRVAGFLVVVYAALLVFIVMWPSSVIASESVWRAWWALQGLGAPEWVTQRKIEFGMNILLFMPLSFLGSVFRPRWGWTMWLLTGLFVTTSIEMFQLLVLPGRTAAWEDILANTLGAVAGYALVTMTRGVARAGRRWG